METFDLSRLQRRKPSKEIKRINLFPGWTCFMCSAPNVPMTWTASAAKDVTSKMEVILNPRDDPKWKLRIFYAAGIDCWCLQWKYDGRCSTLGWATSAADRFKRPDCYEHFTDYSERIFKFEAYNSEIPLDTVWSLHIYDSEYSFDLLTQAAEHAMQKFFADLQQAADRDHHWKEYGLWMDLCNDLDAPDLHADQAISRLANVWKRPQNNTEKL